MRKSGESLVKAAFRVGRGDFPDGYAPEFRSVNAPEPPAVRHSDPAGIWPCQAFRHHLIEGLGKLFLHPAYAAQRVSGWRFIGDIHHTRCYFIAVLIYAESDVFEGADYLKFRHNRSEFLKEKLKR